MIDAHGVLSATGSWAYLIIFLIIAMEGVPFIGPFIPAQLFLLGSGFVARLGHLDVMLVWAVALVTLYFADLFSFWLGHHYGEGFLDRLPRVIQARTRELRVGLALHLRKSLVAAQFLGPARALVPPLAGSAHVPLRKFLAWNLAGCFLWVTTMVGLGWFFGASYQELQAHLGRDAIIVVLLIVVAYLAVQRFRQAKRLDELAAEG